MSGLGPIGKTRASPLNRTVSRLPESQKLALSIRQAREHLTWHPRWEFAETVRQTIGWYRGARGAGDGSPETYKDLTRKTIQTFSVPNV